VAILLELVRCSPKVTDERQYVEEALALARRAGDEASEANALLTYAMLAADPGQQAGPGSDPIRLIEQARATAERRAAHDLLLRAAVNESHLLEGAGEHELAAEAARRAVASADAQRLSRTYGGLLAINEAEPLLALGRWDEAVKVADGAVHLYVGRGPIHRAMLKVMTGSIALARGDYPAATEAEAAAADLLRTVRYEDQHQLPLVRLEIALRLATAGPSAALAATGQALDRYDLSGACPRYAWPVLSTGASACLAAAGSQQDAAAVADRLRTVAEKLGAFGPVQEAHQLTFAAADAHAAHLLDDPPGDAGELLAAWDRAAAAWAALREPHPQAQALLHAAQAALAGRDRDGAVPRLQRAARLAAGLGARPLTEQIATLARRAGITVPGPWVGAGEPDAAAGLTGRELEVLRLVAAGRSNREIAAELFISPKTASVHVSNILGKLGAASRGEAAARAHALGLA
jgi:ATP/maltotriose-dependent transcriptional regulator MalT